MTTSRQKRTIYFSKLHREAHAGVERASQEHTHDVAPEAHHRKKSFSEELRQFVERYGLQWRDEQTAKAVEAPIAAPLTSLQPFNPSTLQLFNSLTL